ncbi:MAG: NUDIX hydrolase [Rhodospirillales bacterium]
MTAAARAYPDRPFAGVGAAVFKGDSVLLVRRGAPPREGAWSLPGGAQELGETALAGALREVMEETGVEAEPAGLIDVVDMIRHDDAGRVERHYTLAGFAMRWKAGEPRPGGDAAEAAFAPMSEITAFDLTPEMLRVIEKGREIVGKGAIVRHPGS